MYPRGFPWVRGVNAKKLAITNLLIVRALLTLKAGYASSAKTFYVLEFPEDLGGHAKGVPASLWQLEDARSAKDTHGESAAHFICQWVVESLKSGRTASNLPGHSDIGYVGWPQHDEHDRYQGPLPRVCPHKGHEPIQGKDDQGNFNTKAFAAYAPRMNRYLAMAFFNAIVARRVAILSEMGGACVTTLEADTSGRHGGTARKAVLKKAAGGPSRTTATTTCRKRVHWNLDSSSLPKTWFG